MTSKTVYLIHPLLVPMGIGTLGVTLVALAIIWWTCYERFEYIDDQDTMFEENCELSGIRDRGAL